MGLLIAVVTIAFVLTTVIKDRREYLRYFNKR